ncbi:MAG: hypothetical protein GF364_20790 [Candidatus Lokiarchaeota archaeon]|nr:hypothetical protein [Candidatus Lokiarchaeota archaeon]
MAKEKSASPNVKPMQCPGCGLVICKKCHKMHFCSHCFNKLSEKQKSRLKKIDRRWYLFLSFFIFWAFSPFIVGGFALLLSDWLESSELLMNIANVVSIGAILGYLPVFCILAFRSNTKKRKRERKIKEIGRELHSSPSVAHTSSSNTNITNAQYHSVQEPSSVMMGTHTIGNMEAISTQFSKEELSNLATRLTPEQFQNINYLTMLKEYWDTNFSEKYQQFSGYEVYHITPDFVSLNKDIIIIMEIVFGQMTPHLLVGVNDIDTLKNSVVTEGPPGFWNNPDRMLKRTFNYPTQEKGQAMQASNDIIFLTLGVLSRMDAGITPHLNPEQAVNYNESSPFYGGKIPEKRGKQESRSTEEIEVKQEPESVEPTIKSRLTWNVPVKLKEIEEESDEVKEEQEIAQNNIQEMTSDSQIDKITERDEEQPAPEVQQEITETQKDNPLSVFFNKPVPDSKKKKKKKKKQKKIKEFTPLNLDIRADLMSEDSEIINKPWFSGDYYDFLNYWLKTIQDSPLIDNSEDLGGMVRFSREMLVLLTQRDEDDPQAKHNLTYHESASELFENGYIDIDIPPPNLTPKGKLIRNIFTNVDVEILTRFQLIPLKKFPPKGSKHECKISDCESFEEDMTDGKRGLKINVKDSYKF